MASTFRDLAVSVGKYTDNQGFEKNRYKTIGQEVTKEDGGKFLLLDADIFHAALFALCNKERKDKVLVSIFEKRDAAGGAAATPAAPKAAGGIADEDVPF